MGAQPPRLYPSVLTPEDVTPRDQRDWLMLFRQYDTTGSGAIPLAELSVKVNAAGDASGLSEQQKHRLLYNADRNGDRLVDFGEFCFLMSRAKQMRMRHVMFRAGQFVVPKSQREEQFSYLQQYSCCPPPVFMLLISIIEITFYVYYVVEMDAGISISQPVPSNSPLIYNPNLRHQIWRFASYMFIHIGIYHIAFNVLTQLMIGVPLELVHQSWRLLLVYVGGVVAGSLAVSVSDPTVYLAGASGGVYALIAAHVANLVVNWAEMELAIFRLIFLVILIGADLGVAIYNRYFDETLKDNSNQVSYVAHLGGFVAGLLLGIVVLRNFKKKIWERAVWWIALIGYIVLFLLCVIYNIFFYDNAKS